MVTAQIISKVLRDKNVDIIIDNDLTEQHFSDMPEEFNFIMSHYKKYGNVPDVETFLSNFNEFEFIEVNETDKYLIDTINEEFTYSQLVPITQNFAEILRTNAKDAYDYIISQLQDVVLGKSDIGVGLIAQAEKRYQKYLEKQNTEHPWNFPTGLPELDEIINGLAVEEEFMVLFARTGVGKSWLLAKILTHIWKVIGVNVGYISPEMSDDSVGYRFDTLNEHFSNHDLYVGKQVDEYEEYIKSLVQGHKDGTIKNEFYVAQPHEFNRNITVSKLRKWCLDKDIKVLAVDGIKYLSDERYRKGDNLTTSLTNISEDLMAMSLELKIPVIVVVQANRGGSFGQSNITPSLESIRDSDGISHNATKVISLSQRMGKLVLSVEKNRNGRDNVKLVYDWNIDVGTFEYDANGDTYIDQQEQSDSYVRRNDNRNTATTEQPTRRAAFATPF